MGGVSIERASDSGQYSSDKCRHLEERLALLLDATRAFAGATSDSRHLLQTVARRVAEIVRDYCVVLLLSDDGRSLIPVAMFDPDPEALRQLNHALLEPFALDAHPVTRAVIESGDPYFAPRLDLAQFRSQTTPRYYDFMQRMGMHSLLLVPLRIHNRSIGELILARFRATSPAFDQHDMDLAQSLASHAALAIDNARLWAEARRETAERKRIAERLHFLADASAEFSAATSDLDRLLDVVARRLGEHVGDMCSIRVVTEDRQWLEADGAVYHRDPAQLSALREVALLGRQRVGEGVSGRVVATGQTLFTPCIEPSDFAGSTEPKYRPFLDQLKVTSAITLPLMCRGEVVGVANLLRSSPGRPYDDEDLRFVQNLAEHAALAIGNARSYAAEREARAVAEQATAALQKSDSRFARLAESGIIGIGVGDLTGRMVQVNDALVEMLGFSRDEILSEQFLLRSLTAPEWHDVDVRAIEQLQTSGIAGLREKEYVRKDGRRVPVMVGSAMLAGETGGVISFMLDLTTRNEAQAATQQLRDAQAADATFRSLLEAAPDAMVVVDRDGQVILINAQTERLFGYAREELLGQTVELLLPERSRGAHPAHRDEYFTAPTVRGMGRGLDLWGRRKDGTEFPIEVTLSPLETKGGMLVSSAIRDITQQKHAEEQLRRAKDVAEAASRELDAFSYSVAHDLRAPLRAISGYSMALVEAIGGDLDASAKGYLDRLSAGAARMGELIDALLGLSRVTGTELVRESVDLTELAHATIAQFRASEPSRAVEFTASEGLHARGHPQLLGALLDNLLGNAWKFTSGCKLARIQLGQVSAKGGGAYFVRDNGAGFDMKCAGKLFAPFQRLHPTTLFPGTGIGLATVQRIVRLHGGEIWAEAEVGRGATFYFTLEAMPGEPR